jgi:ABC-type iron transport system FetAB ATPase subunit
LRYINAFFCSLVIYTSTFTPRGVFLEPTSGLDAKSSKAVEDTLLGEIRDHTKTLKAIIWITHSEEQAERVGTRFLRLTPKGIEETHRSEP